MLEKMPSEEDWAEWLSHPCTKRLRKWADVRRQDLMEQWANGHFSAAFEIEMAVKNAAATGACSIYIDVRTLDYEQIVIGASDDDEQVRTNPTGPSSTGGTI